MKKYIFAILIVILCNTQIFSQINFQTIAESSGFKSTSNYSEVMSFIEKLKRSSDKIRVETMAVTTEGRDVPLLIIADPLPVSFVLKPGDNRIVIYIQANIHAGEVEGKAATLMFARDILADKKSGLLKNIIFLICPNFNPDGNEKISPLNRAYQGGPVNGVGVRYNGQYLDLNRDAMKAESPEVRGVISHVFNAWDPAVFMDCHTTDGSYHVEPVTFTWMVNPDGNNSLIRYMREKMMPEMSSILRDKYKVENCFYGEFIDMADPGKGWIYDASEPRYMTNYYGLRNRLAILNENYVYADFKSRVWGCYYLIRSLGEYVSEHGEDIKKMIGEADEETVRRGANPSPADSFAIGYKVRALPDKVTIQTYEADVITDVNGRRSFRKSDRQRTVAVPYYIDYYPSVNVKFPFAYLITVKDKPVIDLLRLNGIRIEQLTEDSYLPAERFEISGLKGSARLNQGHYTNNITGKFILESVDFPAGTLVVRTAQPLADLVSYLLEPQSNDGLLVWNFFDRYLVPQWGTGYYPFPVYKIPGKTTLSTVPY